MGSQGQVRTASRIRTFARVFSVLSLAVFSAALALLALVLLPVPYADTGISFNGDEVDTVAPGSLAAKAGLREGDRLDPKMPFFERERIGQAYWVPARGQRYTFRIVRDGAVHTITVRVPKEPPQAISPDIWAQYTIGTISVSIFIVVGTLLVLLHPSVLTWMFFLFCVGYPGSRWLGANVALFDLPTQLGFVLNILRTTLLAVGFAAFLRFALRFPNTRAVGWRARVDRFVPVLFVTFLALDYYAWFSDFYVPGDALTHLNTALILAFEGIAVASLVGLYLGSSQVSRQRLAWVVLGTLAGYSTILVHDAIVGYGGPDFLDWPSISIGTQVLSALAPLALGYGIIKHRVIDVRFVVNRVVVLVTIGFMLAGLLLGLDWLSATILVHSPLQIVIGFILVSAMTLALRSGYQRLVVLVNDALFPKRQQHIEHVRDLQIPAANADRETLPVLLTTRVCDALRLASAGVFMRAPDGGFVRECAVGWGPGTAWHLLADDASVQTAVSKRAPWVRIGETAWSGISVPTGPARPVLAIRLLARKKIVGLALYGAHADDIDIDPDEARALGDLCAVAGPAFERFERAQPSVSDASRAAVSASVTT